MEKFEKLPRGAIPTPRHELAAASPHKPDASVVVPAAFLMWPTKTAMWGNDIFGDCVTVEEAFAKATALLFEQKGFPLDIPCGMPTGLAYALAT